jgi:hypothetical protein
MGVWEPFCHYRTNLACYYVAIRPICELFCSPMTAYGWSIMSNLCWKVALSHVRSSKLLFLRLIFFLVWAFVSHHIILTSVGFVALVSLVFGSFRLLSTGWLYDPVKFDALVASVLLVASSLSTFSAQFCFVCPLLAESWTTRVSLTIKVGSLCARCLIIVSGFFLFPGVAQCFCLRVTSLLCCLVLGRFGRT